MRQGYFFFLHYLATSTTDWAQIFTGLLFYVWDTPTMKTNLWSRDLRIRFRGLKIKHLKAHNFAWQLCFFFFIIISQLRRSIELKFLQVCYIMHMLRYTKWEDWSLQWPIVSSVFKGQYVLDACWTKIPGSSLPWLTQRINSGQFFMITKTTTTVCNYFSCVKKSCITPLSTFFDVHTHTIPRRKTLHWQLTNKVSGHSNTQPFNLVPRSRA